MNALGETLTEKGFKFHQVAAVLLRQRVEIRRHVFNNGDVLTISAEASMLRLLMFQHRYPEAQQLASRLMAVGPEVWGSKRCEQSFSTAQRVNACERLGWIAEAVDSVSRCLAFSRTRRRATHEDPELYKAWLNRLTGR